MFRYKFYFLTHNQLVAAGHNPIKLSKGSGYSSCEQVFEAHQPFTLNLYTLPFTLEKDPTRGMQNAGDCFSLYKALSQPLFGLLFPFSGTL